jgi:hypothetical protein
MDGVWSGLSGVTIGRTHISSSNTKLYSRYLILIPLVSVENDAKSVTDVNFSLPSELPNSIQIGKKRLKRQIIARGTESILFRGSIVQLVWSL